MECPVFTMQWQGQLKIFSRDHLSSVPLCCLCECSQVALARLTSIVDASLDALASKRYEEGLSCLAVDPGWLKTNIGGPDAPVRAEVNVCTGVSHRSVRLVTLHGNKLCVFGM